MKLVSMKLPKKSKKEMKDECSPVGYGDNDQWPYGLQIRFETEQLKTLPEILKKKVGDKCIIYAEATVTATRESERQSGKKEQNVELQIEKIQLKSKMNKAVKDMNPGEYREYRKTGGGK